MRQHPYLRDFIIFCVAVFLFYWYLTSGVWMLTWK